MGKFWNVSYTTSSSYSCQKCDDILYNFAFIVALTLWTFFSLIFSIRSQIENVNKKILVKQAKIFNIKSYNQQENNTAVYIKTLTNYIQIISSISTFDIEFPSCNKKQIIKYLLIIKTKLFLNFLLKQDSRSNKQPTHSTAY